MLFRAVKRCVAPGDVVWDVGANVGLFSFPAAVRATSTGSVLAIEADIWLAGLLRRSADRTQRVSARGATVEVVPLAVSDKIGLGSFWIAKRSRSTNHLEGFGSSQTGGERARISVPTMTLDQIALGRPLPTVLKIDVEGAEVQVLRGATAVLASLPKIIIEVAKENIASVDSILSPLGYKYVNAETGANSEKPVADTIAICRQA